MDDGIPAGWRLELDPSARRTDGGRTLIGGSPVQVFRFTGAEVAWLDRLVAGTPLPAASGPRQLARRLVDAGAAIPRPAGDPPASPRDVAVVIPVRDDPEGLTQTLASVAKIGEIGEIVVVDDGSCDAEAVRRITEDIAKDIAKDTSVLRNERSLGAAAARQRGWRATTSPFVAFVDADIGAGGDWLGSLLAHLGDDTVGAAAPRIAPRGSTRPRFLADYEEGRFLLDLGPVMATVRRGSRVSYVPTATLLVRRSALESIDGFDQRMRLGEDVDFVWRLTDAGWRIRYVPSVVLTHSLRRSLRPWIRQRVTYGAGMAPLARRHGRSIAAVSISGWSALAAAALVLRRPGVALTIVGGSAAALVPELRRQDHSPVEALTIAGRTHLWAGRAVCEALRRSWWPLAAILAAISRRSRPALAVGLIAPTVVEWRRRRPPLDPLRFASLHLLDDLSFGTGVWIGCLRERSLRALLPSFTARQPVEAASESEGAPVDPH